MNTRPNPYVGPRAFQAGEPFYGRDHELRSLAALLIAERIVLLHSPSGSGKTSLIQAGLLPRLREEEFNVLPLIRINHEAPENVATLTGFNRYALSTLLSLEENVPEAQRLSLENLATLTIDEYLTKRPRAEGAPLSEVLIFDQFEELLTIAPGDTVSLLMRDSSDGQVHPGMTIPEFAAFDKLRVHAITGPIAVERSTQRGLVVINASQ